MVIRLTEPLPVNAIKISSSALSASTSFWTSRGLSFTKSHSPRPGDRNSLTSVPCGSQEWNSWGSWVHCNARIAIQLPFYLFFKTDLFCILSSWQMKRKVQNKHTELIIFSLQIFKSQAAQQYMHCLLRLPNPQKHGLAQIVIDEHFKDCSRV